MSYVTDLQLTKRRHPVRQLSPHEAIAKLNTIVDEANTKIAKAEGARQHMERVAEELAAENTALRGQVTQLQARIGRLEKQLRKKAGSGKNKWLDDLDIREDSEDE